MVSPVLYEVFVGLAINFIEFTGSVTFILIVLFCVISSTAVTTKLELFTSAFVLSTVTFPSSIAFCNDSLYFESSE